MSDDPAISAALGGTSSRRTVVKTGAKLAYAAPLVAATAKLTAGGAAAISGGATTCIGCAECFAQRDPDNSEAVTPICCPSASVCPGATGAPGDNQCCWFDEVCLRPNTPCCRSDVNGGCDVAADCSGCCRSCGTDATGNRICCDEMEQCVTTQSGQQCEPLNTARLTRARV